jgi:hypothetical protein
MTYVCPVWELTADTHVLKLQCLQNKIPCTIGNFPSCTPVHVAFKFLYVYDYITKLCWQQPECIENHKNEYVHSIGQAKARHIKYKRQWLS